MNNDYSDIIGLPHHTSTRHNRMSMEKRAAQFAPFAALTGYDEVIEETGRYTDEKHELSQYEAERLDMEMNILRSIINSKPYVTIVYFEPDRHKKGGCYKTIYGKATKLEEDSHAIIIESNVRIPIDDIFELRLQNKIELANE